MKKIVLLISFVFILYSNLVFANGITDGIDITDKDYNPYVEYKRVAKLPQAYYRERENYLYLNREIPLCGVDEGATYYLDLTSCNYYIEDGIAYVNCIIYAGGGGADQYGNPAKIAKCTYRFSTYKNGNKRYIRLLSCVNDNYGTNTTVREYEMDNGFLKSIFWKSAGKVGLSQYLD